MNKIYGIKNCFYSIYCQILYVMFWLFLARYR